MLRERERVSERERESNSPSYFVQVPGNKSKVTKARRKFLKFCNQEAFKLKLDTPFAENFLEISAIHVSFVILLGSLTCSIWLQRVWRASKYQKVTFKLVYHQLRRYSLPRSLSILFIYPVSYIHIPLQYFDTSISTHARRLFEARTEEGLVQHRRPKTSRAEDGDTDDEEAAVSSKKQKKNPSPAARAPEADGVDILANAATG